MGSETFHHLSAIFGEVLKVNIRGGKGGKFKTTFCHTQIHRGQVATPFPLMFFVMLKSDPSDPENDQALQKPLLVPLI